MIIHPLFLTCVFCIFTLHSTEEVNEPEAELLETPEESLSTEEELSLLPKKGQRPQVIVTPTKTSDSLSMKQ